MILRLRPIAAFVGQREKWTVATIMVNNIAPQQHRLERVTVLQPRSQLPLISCTRRLNSGQQQQQHDRNDSTDMQPNVTLKRHTFLEKIRESLHRNVVSNLKTNEVVLLVGVSGGCDSVGLLHALMHILIPQQGDFQLFDKTCKLHVVHFNHKQRGAHSDGDAHFVQQVCKTLNLPCHIYEWDDSTEVAFSQNAARQWRRSTMYTLLQSLTCGEGVILTAHHRDDSNETLLLKLLRGVHVTNLMGMDPVLVRGREMPEAIVARPLLNVSKNDIIDFLTLLNLQWREDESNSSDKYLRNRVRNELIPLLSDMMGGGDALQVRL